jgi:hypothetical protein
VVLTPIYATTISVFVSVADNGAQSTSESTITAGPVAPLPTLLFTFNGLVLTWPTTYVAYTSFEHISVSTNVFAQTCASISSPVTLGNPTPWASLVFPTADIPPGLILPTALVDYLDSNPTVVAELGGTIASDCDPQDGATPAAAAAPTATVTLATGVSGVTRSTTTVPAEAENVGTPAPVAPVVENTIAASPAPVSQPAPAPAPNTPAPNPPAANSPAPNPPAASPPAASPPAASPPANTPLVPGTTPVPGITTSGTPPAATTSGPETVSVNYGSQLTAMSSANLIGVAGLIMFIVLL